MYIICDKQGNELKQILEWKFWLDTELWTHFSGNEKVIENHYLSLNDRKLCEYFNNHNSKYSIKPHNPEVRRRFKIKEQDN